MSKEEIQNLIREIMFSECSCGIEIFACLRKEEGYQAKKIKTTSRLLSSIKDKLSSFIYDKFLEDNAEFETSENIADNKKIFYEIKLTDDYNPFAFLDETANCSDHYVEKDRQQLSGFLFKINLNDQFFWIYQHIYPVAKFDKSKHLFARLIKDIYEEIEQDIVHIDSRADIIIFPSVMAVTSRITLIQQHFGFEHYIRSEAQKAIEIISSLNIVKGIEKLIDFENKKQLTNAKKLLKSKNSPVLKMKKDDLLNSVRKHARYNSMFKIENDCIIISTQKDATSFIKMINDDILRSELTGQEYDSSSKLLL